MLNERKLDKFLGTFMVENEALSSGMKLCYCFATVPIMKNNNNGSSIKLDLKGVSYCFATVPFYLIVVVVAVRIVEFRVKSDSGIERSDLL